MDLLCRQNFIAVDVVSVLGLLLLIFGFAYALVRLRRERRVRHQAEESLRVIENVFEHCFDAVMIVDPNNQVVDVNPAYTRLFGYAREEVIGKAAGMSLTERSRIKVGRMLERTLVSRVDWQTEIQSVRKNGEIQDGMLSVSYVCDEAGEMRYAVAVVVDISELKQHEARLERIAHYDTLTGLPNRLLMTQQLETAMTDDLEAHPIAVCYLDLDDFQNVNDDYGQDIGDQVLIEIARRLRGCADVVGHIGGDEYVLLYRNLGDVDACYALLSDVLASVRAPLAVAGFALKLSTSIGVTFYPQDDSSADRLLRHANQAMHMAKDGGKNRLHLFDAEHARRTRNRRDMLAQLRSALDRHEFVLFYQPKVDMVDGRVVGAEALIRWQHPERGLVPPAEFLPYLEGSDLEIAVGEWVIETALAQIEMWSNSAAICIPISVNISPKHLLKPDFAARLQWAVSRYAALPEHSLELEIVENAALGDINAAIAVLTACKKLGFGFALDDFGTGYSSLSYFQRLPVDVLKIDQSFVRNMHENIADREIVESVIKLAQVFNRTVIAEGVETAEHAALLQRIGCRFMQGYGIARPMRADQLLGWIKTWERERQQRSVLVT